MRYNVRQWKKTKEIQLRVDCDLIKEIAVSSLTLTFNTLGTLFNNCNLQLSSIVIRQSNDLSASDYHFDFHISSALLLQESVYCGGQE